MSNLSRRDILIENIANYYIHGLQESGDILGFIRDTLMYGSEETPLDEMSTEDLEELWNDILIDAGEDEHKGVDSDHPSEYDLGIGEEW